MWVQRHLWRIQQSGRFIVFIVYFSLFLDNMLLTVIVPIVPDLLYKEDFATNTANNNDSAAEYEDADCCDSLKNGTGEANICNHSFKNPSRPWFPFSFRNHSGDISFKLDTKIGLLFASKAMIQLIANPLVGTLTNRIGYTTPLFAGSLVLLASSLLFVFGTKYEILFLARSIQGVGSACISISGMAVVADRYQNDKERSKVMGMTLGGTALGVLVGYPFGGMMYDFVGKTAPMAIVAALISLDTVLQLAFLRPRLEAERLLIGTSILKLVFDPYIMLASGAICVSTLAIASLEPCLPIWLLEKMSPPMWQLGTVFIPDSVGYLLGTNVFGVVALRLQRWATAMIALLLVGICAISIPFATKMSHLFIPHFGLGLGIGVTDAALMPLLAYLVDIRYVALYGTVYALAQVAVSMAYSIGPFFGGHLVKAFGFPFLMWTIGTLNLLYCPLCYFLKNVKPSEESKAINMNTAAPVGVRSFGAEGRATYSSFVDEE